MSYQMRNPVRLGWKHRRKQVGETDGHGDGSKRHQSKPASDHRSEFYGRHRLGGEPSADRPLIVGSAERNPSKTRPSVLPVRGVHYLYGWGHHPLRMS